jgi:DNA-binding MarR family transcriptional regulator
MLIMKMRNALRRSNESGGSLPPLPCACSTLRRAARAITQLYEEELRPTGLRVTQFTLLLALERSAGTTQVKLGELLALDTTTLTRMLKLLEQQGWILSTSGDDRRARHLHLTTAGRRKLTQAQTYWKQAQARLLGALGEESWTRLQRLLDITAQAAQEA